MWRVFRARTLIIIAAVVLVVAALITVAVLFYNGILWFNNPSRKDYPVRGVDLSAYQGDVDWEVLSKQDIMFAYIKATQGADSVDPKFSINFEKANMTGLRVGAYHFFSYEEDAAAQAENFIATVPAAEGMLPPMVDIEFYGGNDQNPPDKAESAEKIMQLLGLLEKHYGVKPVIYATDKAYDLYIADGFEEYDIWIRSLVGRPRLSDGREWTFWQFSNRGRLEGFEGEQRFIDLNVFNGSEEEFRQYGS